jgi:hypothetical protein
MVEEDAIILSEGGVDKKRLRFSLKEYKGVPLLDIRYFFRDMEGGFSPTRKGVSISRNRYLDFKTVIEEHHETINAYLAKEDVAVDGGLRNKEHAARKATSVGEVNVSIENLQGGSFYEAEHLGSTIKIKLNARHPCTSGVSPTSACGKNLAKFAAAFDVAASLASDSESIEVLDAIERLKSELARQLSNLSWTDD